jgi:hypothetical protein
MKMGKAIPEEFRKLMDQVEEVTGVQTKSF